MKEYILEDLDPFHSERKQTMTRSSPGHANRLWNKQFKNEENEEQATLPSPSTEHK